MFNAAFDRSLGEYISRYCIKHKVTPQEAIHHQSVLCAAEYYWKEAKDSGISRVDLRIGCGSSSAPIANLSEDSDGGK